MELEEKEKEEELKRKHSKLKIQKLLKDVEKTIKKNGYIFWNGRMS